ncbi:MAG: spermidine synthase [Proteobacteria bacterium]|nr:spermidine synthase [Pseudomonadota bacterium]MBU1582179.1 spermidine synthase [Pseudomonadota bacterium]MBU2454712.1 spermidine synthase [Pseudomonadota bacterium]MBU2631980.1 spermidine synthase [Pseudomonadota bacterium]
MENYKKIKDGWFSETCYMWPGVSLSLEIEQVLYSKKSKFQQIDVYQTRNHGKMLVLDGIIQLTESDEFAYQEMLAHVPLFAHPTPENVLVIGGGDGGILREVGRHDCVKTIDFCEIDEDVITVSKEFLPELACGFDDPRVNIRIGDGNAYVQEQKNKYDVIIVDSSDPIGPGEVLFKRPFYEGLKAALRKKGIIATQGESFFLHKECVTNLVRITKELFSVSAYSYILVPTYPGGHIGICLGSLGSNLKMPCRNIPETLQEQLKYYSPQIHEASFVLPYFAQKMFETV